MMIHLQFILACVRHGKIEIMVRCIVPVSLPIIIIHWLISWPEDLETPALA